MYSKLIIDSLNIGHRLFYSDEVQSKITDIVKIGQKRVYRSFLRCFIETIKHLEKKFLSESGEVIFLYDNYTSREELKAMLQPCGTHESRKKINPTYKAHRQKARKEFYNSMDLLRYYYLVGDKKYHTARIPNLEADDLLIPCIEKFSNEKLLIVSNDRDWAKTLSDHTDMLIDLYSEPIIQSDYQYKYGYFPSEESIILDKILNGDDSDNIDKVFPEFSSKERLYILQNYTNLIDFIFDSQTDPNLKEHVSLIKDREKDVKLAYKMLATIPVTKQHFDAVYTTGRNGQSLTSILDRIIFYVKDPFDSVSVQGIPVTEKPEEGFTFGDIEI